MSNQIHHKVTTKENLFENIENIFPKKTKIKGWDDKEVINSILIKKNNIFIAFKEKKIKKYYKNSYSNWEFKKNILELNFEPINIYKFKRIFWVEETNKLHIYINYRHVKELKDPEFNLIDVCEKYIIIYYLNNELKLFNTSDFKIVQTFTDFRDNPVVHMKLQKDLLYLFNKNKLFFCLDLQENNIEDEEGDDGNKDNNAEDENKDNNIEDENKDNNVEDDKNKENIFKIEKINFDFKENEIIYSKSKKYLYFIYFNKDGYNFSKFKYFNKFNIKFLCQFESINYILDNEILYVIEDENFYETNFFKEEMKEENTINIPLKIQNNLFDQSKIEDNNKILEGDLLTILNNKIYLKEKNEILIYNKNNLYLENKMLLYSSNILFINDIIFTIYNKNIYVLDLNTKDDNEKEKIFDYKLKFIYFEKYNLIVYENLKYYKFKNNNRIKNLIFKYQNIFIFNNYNNQTLIFELVLNEFILVKTFNKMYEKIIKFHKYLIFYLNEKIIEIKSINQYNNCFFFKNYLEFQIYLNYIQLDYKTYILIINKNLEIIQKINFNRISSKIDKKIFIGDLVIEILKNKIYLYYDLKLIKKFGHFHLLKNVKKNVNYLVNIDSKRIIYTLSKDYFIFDIIEKYIYILGKDYRLFIYDFIFGIEIYNEINNNIINNRFYLRFFANYFIIPVNNETSEYYDLNTKNFIGTYERENCCNNLLILQDSNKLDIYDLKSKRIIKTFDNLPNLHFSSYSKNFIILYDNINKDKAYLINTEYWINIRAIEIKFYKKFKNFYSIYEYLFIVVEEKLNIYKKSKLLTVLDNIYYINEIFINNNLFIMRQGEKFIVLNNQFEEIFYIYNSEYYNFKNIYYENDNIYFLFSNKDIKKINYEIDEDFKNSTIENYDLIKLFYNLNENVLKFEVLNDLSFILTDLNNLYVYNNNELFSNKKEVVDIIYLEYIIIIINKENIEIIENNFEKKYDGVYIKFDLDKENNLTFIRWKNKLIIYKEYFEILIFEGNCQNIEILKNELFFIKDELNNLFVYKYDKLKIEIRNPIQNYYLLNNSFIIIEFENDVYDFYDFFNFDKLYEFKDLEKFEIKNSELIITFKNSNIRIYDLTLNHLLKTYNKGEILYFERNHKIIETENKFEINYIDKNKEFPKEELKYFHKFYEYYFIRNYRDCLEIYNLEDFSLENKYENVTGYLFYFNYFILKINDQFNLFKIENLNDFRKTNENEIIMDLNNIKSKFQYINLELNIENQIENLEIEIKNNYIIIKDKFSLQNIIINEYFFDRIFLKLSFDYELIFDYNYLCVKQDETNYIFYNKTLDNYKELCIDDKFKQYNENNNLILLGTKIFIFDKNIEYITEFENIKFKYGIIKNDIGIYFRNYKLFFSFDDTNGNSLDEIKEIIIDSNYLFYIHSNSVIVLDIKFNYEIVKIIEYKESIKKIYRSDENFFVTFYDKTILEKKVFDNIKYTMKFNIYLYFSEIKYNYLNFKILNNDKLYIDLIDILYKETRAFNIFGNYLIFLYLNFPKILIFTQENRTKIIKYFYKKFDSIEKNIYLDFIEEDPLNISIGLRNNLLIDYWIDEVNKKGLDFKINLEQFEIYFELNKKYLGNFNKLLKLIFVESKKNNKYFDEHLKIDKDEIIISNSCNEIDDEFLEKIQKGNKNSKNVDIKNFNIAFPDSITKILNFLEIYLESSDEIKTSDVKYIIYEYWGKINFTKYLNLSIFIIMIFTLILKIIYYPENILLLVISFLANSLLLVYEIIQMHVQFKSYITEIYNYLDLSIIILNYIILFLSHFKVSDTNNIVYFITIYLNGIRFLSLIKPFDRFRIQIRLFIKVLTGSIDFLLFIFIIVGYLTFISLINPFSDVEDKNYIYGFATVYNMMLGNWNDSFREDFTYKHFIEFFLNTFIFTIVLLNLYIAVVSKIFEDYNDNKELYDLNEITQLLIEFSALWSVIKKKENEKYIFVIKKKTEKLEEEDNNMNYFKDKINELKNENGELRSELSLINNKLDKILNKTTN